MSLNIVSGIFLIIFFKFVYADFYSALDEVGYLLATRKQVTDDLVSYIDTEKKTLILLKRYLQLFKKEHEILSKDVTSYFDNPMNAFVLIKRLIADLKHARDVITSENNIIIEHNGMQYPNLTDLIGAVKGLMVIQEAYHLQVKDIAQGNLNGFDAGTLMTASDCYELGRILFNELDPEAATSWMEEALYKYQTEEFPYLFTEVDIMEFISYGNSMLGNSKTALHWINKILIVDPNHSRARRSAERYQREIDELEKKSEEGDKLNEEYSVYGAHQEKEELTENSKFKIPMSYEISESDQDDPETYHAMCRGDIVVPGHISSRLTCRYLKENHPFLTIGPMKIEMIYVNPDIVLYHDVLSNAEIEGMINLAKPRLRRSVIEDKVTGAPIPSDDRISKTATMMDVFSATLRRISHRTMQMTGLSMKSTSYTQVANYGIGGYYLPHHDFTKVNNDTYKIGGRRIATVLFYLSDVSQGGATIFTRLGVRVPPIKGSAVFWYNLHPSGEGNHALVHAGCPIMRGSKWVATKWILQGGQELIKPCNLQREPEGFINDIPTPIEKTIRDR